MTISAAGMVHCTLQLTCMQNKQQDIWKAKKIKHTKGQLTCNNELWHNTVNNNKHYTGTANGNSTYIQEYNTNNTASNIFNGIGQKIINIETITQAQEKWTGHWPDEVSANGTKCRLAKKCCHEFMATDLMYSTLAGIASIAHCIFLLLKQLFFYCTYI